MVVFLLLLLGQVQSLSEATKNLEAKNRKLADAHQAMVQLVSALEVAQQEVIRANQEVEQAAATLLRIQNAGRAAQIDAQQKAVDAIKGLIGAQPKPMKKPPPAKSIFDSRAKPPPPKVEPKEPDAVAELAAIIAAGNAQDRKDFPAEIASKPPTLALVWSLGTENWNYVWLNDKPLAGHPGSIQKRAENWSFYVDEQWIKHSDLRPASGTSGWTRYSYNGTPVLAKKGTDYQLFHQGKWYWVP